VFRLCRNLRTRKHERPAEGSCLAAPRGHVVKTTSAQIFVEQLVVGSLLPFLGVARTSGRRGVQSGCRPPSLVEVEKAAAQPRSACVCTSRLKLAVLFEACPAEMRSLSEGVVSPQPTNWFFASSRLRRDHNRRGAPRSVSACPSSCGAQPWPPCNVNANAPFFCFGIENWLWKRGDRKCVRPSVVGRDRRRSRSPLGAIGFGMPEVSTEPSVNVPVHLVVIPKDFSAVEHWRTASHNDALYRQGGSGTGAGIPFKSRFDVIRGPKGDVPSRS